MVPKKVVCLMMTALTAATLLTACSKSATAASASTQPAGSTTCAHADASKVGKSKATSQAASKPAATQPATTQPAATGQATTQPAASQPTTAPAGPPEVVITTSMGEIRVKLWSDLAPKTVENFLAYVDSGYYNATIFHRVIDGFMIQGGGFNEQMQERPTRAPIRNEASAAAKNRRGTIAMARTNDPHSATAQFFINHGDRNDFLDHRDNTVRGYGYAAFGEVTAGMDVVDRIAKVKTTRVGPYEDVPAQPVVIQSIRRAK